MSIKRQTVTTKGRSLSYYRIDADRIFQELPLVIPRQRQPVQFVTDHWTAGAHHHAYTSYQILIGNDYILVSPDIFRWAWHGHTWKRNTYNIGVSYMAMASSKHPITDQMIRANGAVKAVLVKELGLAWAQFKDHDYFSKLDGYDSLRWDAQLMLADASARAAGLKQESVHARGVRYGKAAYQAQYMTKKETPKVEAKPLFENLQGTPFNDVDPSRYSADAVRYVYENGLLVGHKTNEGHAFKPQDPVTREQLAVALKKVHEMQGLTEKISPDPEHEYYHVAKALHAQGLLNATGKDDMGQPTFGLHKPATYGDVLAAVLALTANPAGLQRALEALKNGNT